jgi:hypothetical protein
MPARASAVVLSFAMLGCGGSDGPTTPTNAASTATVRIVFMGSTTRRTDLPSSAAACVNGVGPTHTHPSWRSFAGIPLVAVPPDRYEITFTDAPVNTRLSFRVNDQNSCDENPTGAVTRNVFVNNIRLIQNATTPGNGDEPGFAFTVAPNGNISQ